MNLTHLKPHSDEATPWFQLTKREVLCDPHCQAKKEVANNYNKHEL